MSLPMFPSYMYNEKQHKSFALESVGITSGFEIVADTFHIRA